jgi:hypothetical protein
VAATKEELALIDGLKARCQPLPEKGTDTVLTGRPGADRAHVAHAYERLEWWDDAVRWYLEASDFAVAVGQLPTALSWARMGLKVNPLDSAAREKVASLTAQLDLSDDEA